MPPRSRDPLTLAMEQLMQALAKANARAGAGASAAPPPPAAPLSAADAALMNAVATGDIPAIAAAVAGGADVNTGNGKPLQLAAHREDAEAMKELVILGAEVSIAIAGLKNEQAALPSRGTLAQRANDPEVRAALQDLMEALVPRGGRYRISDQDVLQLLKELDKQSGGGSLPSQNGKRQQEIAAAIATLGNWETHFIKSVAPVETLRMQRKILDALAEMKLEFTQKTLDKPRLAAPRKTEPPQPG
ncbi:MAG: hypothetical protein EPN97_09615 [Alphaproteobacteria bacterium]|nr:MAG: hypothetical protein EPN97_09615 [Alphaproteobacteria bacterium]